jgi:hypothetical protein
LDGDTRGGAVDRRVVAQEEVAVAPSPVPEAC